MSSIQQSNSSSSTGASAVTTSTTSTSKYNTNEDFVADPLPFDYSDFQHNHEMAGREMINMAHMGVDENGRMAPRRLPEPKAFREHHHPQQHHYQPVSYGYSQPHHHPLHQYSLPHQVAAAAAHHHHTLQQQSQQQQQYGNLHSNHHPMMYAAPSPTNLQPNHSFQAMLDHHSSYKKDNTNTYHPAAAATVSHHHPVQQTQQQHFTMPYINTQHNVVNTSTAQQEVSIKLKTQLKQKYWRNGRRNLQCFPNCKVFGDYSYIKIDDLKQHDFMWGKCRGSLVAEITLNGSFSFEDLVILSRVHSLENIPVPFEEAVMGECMIGRIVASDIMDIMKDQWIAGERLPDFMHNSTRAACFEFKPKVWKYSEDMSHGKCKRRNVRYYIQFEAFIPVYQGDVRSYMCVGSGMSTSFEVGSSRVLARQKRKAAGHSTGESTKKVKPELPSSPIMLEQATAVLASLAPSMTASAVTTTTAPIVKEPDQEPYAEGSITAITAL